MEFQEKNKRKFSKLGKNNFQHDFLPKDKDLKYIWLQELKNKYQYLMAIKPKEFLEKIK